jgi:hypothetical protein
MRNYNLYEGGRALGIAVGITMLFTLMIAGGTVITVSASGGNANGGQAPQIEWIRQFNVFGPGPYQDRNMAIDANNNIYVAGGTDGTLPGQTSSGGNDAYVRKYSSDGTEIWTRQFGTSESDSAKGISIDASGNIYVAGTTGGTFPGQTKTSYHYNDIYVRKYSSDGTEIWTRQFGISVMDNHFYGISADSSGNVYITGNCYEGNPVYVRKYSSNGTEVWTRKFSANDKGLKAGGISADFSGNVYIVGDSGPGNLSGGGHGPYLRKYSSEGTEVWTKFTTLSYSGISVDFSGNVYVIGPMFGYLGEDAYVSKYGSDGTEVWTRQFSTSRNNVSARGISVDASGNVYVAGDTDGTFRGQTSPGGNDVYARKYNSDGIEIWTRQFGTSKNDSAEGISVDFSGNVYVAGSAYETFLENQDAFVVKIVDKKAKTKNLSIQDLIDDVRALNLQHGIENSLEAKLEAARKDVNKNNNAAAINALKAFSNEVRAQSGKKIPDGTADTLIAAAQRIIDELRGAQELPPTIVRVETFREGDMVFFRLFFTDPDKDAEGFGFRGANGSGWAEETHPFSSPSYGRVSPGRIEYPFNLLCETGPAYESDVEAWIYDSSGLISPLVTVHLACSSTEKY